MPVTDLQNIEITKGKHYHAWVLGPSITTIYTGQEISSLTYGASMFAHLSRATATRHAKEMAGPGCDKSEYMARKCGGGVNCPLLHYLGTPFAAQAEPEAVEAFKREDG